MRLFPYDCKMYIWKVMTNNECTSKDAQKIIYNSLDFFIVFSLGDIFLQLLTTNSLYFANSNTNTSWLPWHCGIIPNPHVACKLMQSCKTFDWRYDCLIVDIFIVFYLEKYYLALIVEKWSVLGYWWMILKKNMYHL